jgi:hypothetical protein
MTEMELLDAATNALWSEDIELWRKAVDELAMMGLRVYVLYEPGGMHLTACKDDAEILRFVDALEARYPGTSVIKDIDGRVIWGRPGSVH